MRFFSSRFGPELLWKVAATETRVGQERRRFFSSGFGPELLMLEIGAHAWKVAATETRAGQERLICAAL